LGCDDLLQVRNLKLFFYKLHPLGRKAFKPRAFKHYHSSCHGDRTLPKTGHTTVSQEAQVGQLYGSSDYLAEIKVGVA
jgi:hypothetical protein